MCAFIQRYNNTYTNIEPKGLVNFFDDHKVKLLTHDEICFNTRMNIHNCIRLVQIYHNILGTSFCLDD